MCDASTASPDTTKGKKVIKFERMEALLQTMCQCPQGRIYVCACRGRGVGWNWVGVSGVVNIQCPGEREEGGQRGTEDDILSLSASRCLSLSQHDFLYLLFLFSLNRPNICHEPLPILLYIPIPSYHTVTHFLTLYL